MEPIHGFIISTENRYNNKVEVDGKELIVNTEITERDFEFVNRIGTVLEVPRTNDTKIKKGDKVIVHHNVFRRWFDVRGNERNSGSYLSEDQYICYTTQIFGYNSGDGWNALDGFAFVAPMDETDQWSTEDEKPHVGILTYKSDDVDIPLGSKVGFKPGGEYEFVIDGQKLYRILSHLITIQYDGLQETERANNALV